MEEVNKDLIMFATTLRKTKLKDVCKRITVAHVGPMVCEGVPFFLSQNIEPFRLNLQEFDRIVEPIQDKAELLAMKICNLRQSRDLLLPRLLSGQIELNTKTA